MCGCDVCGAWVVWPRPQPEQLALHYAQGERGLPAQLRALREGTTQDAGYMRIATKLRGIAGADIRSAVDVGAGGLELTHALARVWPEAQVEAWDLFADRADPRSRLEESSRVTLRTIDLNRIETASVPERMFDLVACVAVIEHVIDPLSLLRLLRSITAPGGVAYVAGPDAGSIARRLLGARWPYYCPDEHLTIPTFDSIRKAIAIAGGGEFELRRFNVPYSLRYLLRFLRIPLPLPRIADAIVSIPTGAFELIWRPHSR
jgi:SAM-dependent methyltransferase